MEKFPVELRVRESARQRGRGVKYPEPEIERTQERIRLDRLNLGEKTT